MILDHPRIIVEVPLGKHISTQGLKIFSFNELDSATQNFKQENFLGQGDFGQVYKGWVDEKTYSSSTPEDGMIIAVKRLYPQEINAYKGLYSDRIFKEVQFQLEKLEKIIHVNFVKLLGYCLEGNAFLLVYEFMENGSLYSYLSRNPVPWETRLKILVGAARGLAFLHTTKKVALNMQFKTCNILLDGEYNAKISDFGLEKLCPKDGVSYDESCPYAPPEHAYRVAGGYDMKSDLYGFGVVLVESLTGMHRIDKSREVARHDLLIWVKHLLHTQEFFSLVDSRLEHKYPRDGPIRLGELVNLCTQYDPIYRPSMQLVLEILEEISALKMEVGNCIAIAAPSGSTSENSGDVQEVHLARHVSAPSGSSTENSGDFQEVPLARRASTHDLKIFSFDELDSATQNFKQENLLGQGEFGRVYKGWVHEMTYSPTLEVGMIVAIKRLYPGKVKSFKLIVERLGKYHHANFVKLLGYHFKDKEFLLVYEFMENGSLATHLYESAEPLPWFRRVKILLGAAQGVAFLHKTMKVSSNKQFGAHNILLDQKFNSKLSYLGLEPAYKFPVFTSSYATLSEFCDHHPYAPPETHFGEYDMMSDVFVFGAVLLETLTGLQKYTPGWNMNKQRLEMLCFPVKVDEYDRKDIWSIVDSRLEHNYPREGAVLLGQLAHRCLADVPKDRPSMEQVLVDLRRVYEV